MPDKQPELSEYQIQVEALDTIVSMGKDRQTIAVTLTNLGSESILPKRKYPINLAYHILDCKGNIIVFDGERTPVYEEIAPGTQRNMYMQLRIPFNLDPEGEYICRITLVAEGCFWFDEEGKNKKDILLRILN